METVAQMVRLHCLADSSFSNAELMFLNRFMPGLILGTFLQRMVLPEHTSPRNPMISPFLSVKANPSPLFRTGTSELPPPDERLKFRLISISLFFNGLTDTTLPMASPIPFGVSRLAQCPRFPSRNSSVYPLLNVLLRSGVNPPDTLPNDALQYLSGCFLMISSRAWEYALTVFFTYEMFLSRPSILKESTPASARSSRRCSRL